MAAALVLIWRFFQRNPDRQWVHVENYFKGLSIAPAALRGDFPKLRFWDFLVANTEANEYDPSNPRAGEYRVTPAGTMFARNEITAPAWVWMFNRQVFRDSSAPRINIVQALGTYFSYAELLGNEGDR